MNIPNIPVIEPFDPTAADRIIVVRDAVRSRARVAPDPRIDRE